jgi:hypothetical protein
LQRDQGNGISFSEEKYTCKISKITYSYFPRTKRYTRKQDKHPKTKILTNMLMTMGYYCSKCKHAITEGVHQYSMDRFGKALCMEHQKTATSETQYTCDECKQTITYGEFKFSTKNFDMPLCRDCQPEIEEKISAPPQNFRLNQTSKIEFGKSSPKKDV